MKYSIILPVRNGGEYVKECVSSILAQTLDNFNLLVLDNCSTDGTTQWLNSINDTRIKVYPAEKPLSIEENWGRIKEIPKNEFITLIGHDDLLDADYLEIMDQLIMEYPDAGYYQGHFRYIDSNNKLIRSCKPMDTVQNKYEFLGFFLSGMSELSIGQVIRSAKFDEVGGIPPYSNLLYADLQLWINLLQNGYRATTFKECCSYRIHTNSTTNSSSPIKYYYAFKNLLEYFIELKEKDKRYADVFQKYGLDFLKKYCKSIAHHLLRVPKKERETITVSGYIAEFKEYIDILVPENDFYPEKIFQLNLAKKIDNNSFLRNLFLNFKKLYPKPVIKK